MKRPTIRTLSAIFALAMILTMLPMAALATEADDALPTNLVCKDGEHVYSSELTLTYTDCGGVHRVDARNCCVVCGLENPKYPSTSYYEEHHETKTKVGVDPDNGLPIYRLSCVECGHSRYATE